ncbi:hypothetical protein [Clostridium manihotivorum]|uniref:Uncharacterized protein n=1 Tax=Clostridium manihotivorum TaxID=2320868 RepID=A0A3R5QU06_9CLOT|nr:hypothetical protein [Clostridium manihotivorum]QAA32332.1 hypothetical protein C1I91_12170 [Clostridium manihotivorum]
MHYVKAVFNADNCGILAYGFKVNMLCKELEITYDNFQEGYTSKGIKLNDKQYAHLQRLLKVKNFKASNMNMERYYLVMDPYEWTLQCISDDGSPMLDISGVDGDLIPPKPISILVEYVVSIGIEVELLKAMRLF